MTAPSQVPVPLRVAAALAVLEGVALLGVGVYVALGPLSHTVTDVGLTELEAALALAGGLILLGCSRALLRLRRWARTPLVLLQLLALPVGVGLLQGSVFVYGVPLLLLALVTLGAVLAPAARAPFE